MISGNVPTSQKAGYSIIERVPLLLTATLASFIQFISRKTEVWRDKAIERYLKKCCCGSNSNRVSPGGEKVATKIETQPSFHTEEELIGYLLIIDLLFEFLMIFWFPCMVAFLEVQILNADATEAILAALANMILQFIPEVAFTIAIFSAINMHPDRVRKEIEVLEPWFLVCVLCAFGGAVALSMYGIAGNMLREF